MTLRELMVRISAETRTDRSLSDSLQLCGKNVRLDFTTKSLARIFGKSMRHLRRTHAGPPDLVITCCTGDGQVEFKPPENWPSDGVVFLEEDSICVSWEPTEGTLIVYDRLNRCSWIRFADEKSITGWDKSTPFRKILHWWANDLGLQLVHAACVGGNSGGVLLVGKGGSGKSTTALACLDKQLGFIGDDYCLVEYGKSPVVHSLYVSAKGDANSATLLRGLRDSLRNADLRVHTKSVIFADEVRPEAVLRQCPLKGIVVPQIVGGTEYKLKKLSAVESLRAIAPSTLFQLPGHKEVNFKRLAELVQRIPSWSLQLGNDPYEAVKVLSDLLQSATAK